MESIITQLCSFTKVLLRQIEFTQCAFGYVLFHFLVKKLNPLRAKWPMEPALIPGFCSVKQMRVFDFP